MAELSIAEADQATPRHGVSLREAFRVWLRVAMLSFGGPAGQIAVMHRILVEEKRWISESRFLHALNYCMLLPGPEAQQLATYIGWLMHRTLGGIMAGVLFVIPGIIAIMALSYVYAAYGNVPVIVALFFGLKAAVLAIVLEAVLRIGKRSLKNNVDARARRGRIRRHFLFRRSVSRHHLRRGVDRISGRLDWNHCISGQRRPWRSANKTQAWSTASLAMNCRSMRGRRLRGRCGRQAFGLRFGLFRLSRCWLPWVPHNVFSQIAVFFSKMAMVTFGGAYAVLAYVAQQAVENYGWLKPGEMLDGLGHGRDDARAAHHGFAVRGLHGRFPRPRHACRR